MNTSGQVKVPVGLFESNYYRIEIVMHQRNKRVVMVFESNYYRIEMQLANAEEEYKKWFESNYYRIEINIGLQMKEELQV